MLDKLPTSQQKLRHLIEISSAPKQTKDEDYLALKNDYDNMVNFLTSLISLVNDGDFSPLSGTGSPEGVVAANYNQFYVDTATGDVYFNPTFGADTGWIVTT